MCYDNIKYLVYKIFVLNQNRRLVIFLYNTITKNMSKVLTSKAHFGTPGDMFYDPIFYP